MGEYLGGTYPVARKEHRCYLCGRPIVEGQVHIKRVGLYEGDFSSTRMHMRCENATRDWDEEEWGTHDEFEFREVYEVAEWADKLVWVVDERELV
jgi:hypothetical protein